MRHLLLFWLFALPITSMGQYTVQAGYGSKQKFYKHPVNFVLEERNGDIYTIGVKGGSYYIIPKYKDVFLNVFDGESLDLKETYEIERFKFQENTTRLVEAVANETGIHLLFEAKDSKKDILYLVHQKITQLGESSDPRLLAEIENVSKYGAEFIFYPSENKKTLMVYEEAKKDREVVRTPEVSLFNEEFDLIWKGTVISPFPNRFFVPVQSEVSETGELFILGYAKNRNERTRDDRKTSDYGIVRIFKNETPKVYTFSDEQKIIHNLSIHPDYKGSLLVAGFYAEGANTPVRGSVFGRLNQNSLEEEDLIIKEFEEGVFSYFQADERSRLEDKLSRMFDSKYEPAFEGMDFFEYRDFVDHPAGGVVVVAERRYGSGDLREWTPGTTLYAYFDEIALFYFDKSGSLEWFRIVPKRQITTNLSLASYFLHESENGIDLLYNDHPNNIDNLAEGKPIQAASESPIDHNVRAVWARVDWSGEVGYYPIDGRNEGRTKLYINFLTNAEKQSIIGITLKGLGFKYWVERYRLSKE